MRQAFKGIAMWSTVGNDHVKRGLDEGLGQPDYCRIREDVG